MTTEYPVAESLGETSVYITTPSTTLRDVATINITPRRFVFLWAEDDGNEEFSTEFAYVAGVSGYVNNDLSISWGRPRVIFEENEENPRPGIDIIPAKTPGGFFLLINEFSAGGTSYYTLRGVSCFVSSKGNISVGIVTDIEPPTDDDNLRIRVPALCSFTETSIGLFYATENSSNPITQLKTRLITISGVGFNFSIANTHALGTDMLNFEPYSLTSTHGILRYLDGATYTIRVMERSGSTFSFGSAISLGGSVTRLSRVNDTTFCQVEGEEIRILEINPVALNIETTGAYVNWYPFDLSGSGGVFNIKDDQLLVFAQSGGTQRANGVSVNGTVASVPASFVDLGPSEGVASREESTLLGYGLIVANFDNQLSPFGEEGGVFAISYSGAFTPSTTLHLIGMGVTFSTAYITAWADGLLVLNKVSLLTNEQIDSIFLGTATLAQVQNKTFLAYPCVLGPDHIFIFGRIDTGIGIFHVLFSNDGGSNFEVIEGNWGADYAGAMVCITENDFYVMRCNSGSSKLYKNIDGNLTILSTLPFKGPVTPHGLRLSPFDESLLATINNSGDPLTVVYTLPPYLAWQDITTNHTQTAVNAVVPL